MKKIAQTFYIPKINYGRQFNNEIGYGDAETKANIIKYFAGGIPEGWSIVAVHAFNVEEGWARDVSNEIAREVHAHIAAKQFMWGMEEIDRNTIDFLERHGSIYLANSLRAAE